MTFTPEYRRSNTNVWLGRIATGLTAAIVLMSAIAKMAGVPKMVNGLTHAGIPRPAVLPIAVLELTCLLLYLLPRSGVLGTLLLTGFFGGAIVTHIIGGESFLPPLFVGALACAGAYLRFPELRHVLPLRKPANPSSESAVEDAGASAIARAR